MTKQIIANLEQIAYLAKEASSADKLSEVIQTTKKLAQDLKLDQLSGELATWESKLSVILKEPVGRQGMAKHAAFWADKLRNTNGR